MVTRTKPPTRLARELEAQGKNPGWLAKRTGYSYKHCWHVVTGRAEPSLAFLRRCAEELGVPVASLIEEQTEVA